MTKLILSIAAMIAAAGFLLGPTASAQAETVVRDHRNKTIVRDHRSRPVVRDHRKPNFCFGAITGTNCYRF